MTQCILVSMKWQNNGDSLLNPLTPIATPDRILAQHAVFRLQIIFFTCRVRSSLPMPSLSIPALLLAKVSPVTPAVPHRIEQAFRDAAQAKTAAGNQQVISEQSHYPPLRHRDKACSLPESLLWRFNAFSGGACISKPPCVRLRGQFEQ